MTTTVGAITGIKQEPEPDGGHMIQVANFGEDPFDVWIRPDQVADLVAVLQTGALSQAMGAGPTPRFPQLTVQSVGLAHQAKETALLVTTAEFGAVVFRLSDPALQNLESEIARAKTFRSGPASTN